MKGIDYRSGDGPFPMHGLRDTFKPRFAFHLWNRG
jgi:hypothetical protein